MSSYWQYYLINENTWNSVFGGGNEEAKRLVLTAVAPWSISTADAAPQNEQAYLSDTIEELKDFVDQVCNYGISYQNLSESDSDLMDKLIINCLNSEGSRSLLNPIVAHKEGIRPFVLEELLSRSKDINIGGFFSLGSKLNKGFPVSLAKHLVEGRRIDSESKPDHMFKYFLLSPDEVLIVLSEIEGLLSINRLWSHPDIESSIRDDLVTAIENAKSRGLCLAGIYCG